MQVFPPICLIMNGMNVRVLTEQSQLSPPRVCCNLFARRTPLPWQRYLFITISARFFSSDVYLTESAGYPYLPAPVPLAFIACAATCKPALINILNKKVRFLMLFHVGPQKHLYLWDGCVGATLCAAASGSDGAQSACDSTHRRRERTRVPRPLCLRYVTMTKHNLPFIL